MPTAATSKDMPGKPASTGGAAGQSFTDALQSSPGALPRYGTTAGPQKFDAKQNQPAATRKPSRSDQVSNSPTPTVQILQLTPAHPNLALFPANQLPVAPSTTESTPAPSCAELGSTINPAPVSLPASSPSFVAAGALTSQSPDPQEGDDELTATSDPSSPAVTSSSSHAVPPSSPAAAAASADALLPLPPAPAAPALQPIAAPSADIVPSPTLAMHASTPRLAGHATLSPAKTPIAKSGNAPQPTSVPSRPASPAPTVQAATSEPQAGADTANSAAPGTKSHTAKSSAASSHTGTLATGSQPLQDSAVVTPASSNVDLPQPDPATTQTGPGSSGISALETKKDRSAQIDQLSPASNPLAPFASSFTDANASSAQLGAAAEPRLANPTPQQLQSAQTEATRSAALHPGNGPESATGLPSVSSARLLQTFSRSEMQVSVDSEDFGRVTVHTAYGRDAISAQITLDNPQLGSALSTHAASIEQKLVQDHGLRASVTIDTQARGGSGSGGDRGASDQSPRQSYSGDTAASAGLSAASASNQTPLSAAALSATTGQPRLDIRI